MALGHIGMSLYDFESLTPSEFKAIADAFSRKEERKLHDDWARMRQLAAIVVQLHSNKKVDATKLMPFPWDKKAKQDGHQKSDPTRFKELVNKLEHGK